MSSTNGHWGRFTGKAGLADCEAFSKQYENMAISQAESRSLLEDIIPKTYNVEISGNPEKQATYFEMLLDRANREYYLLIVAFLHRDYDALWEKIKSMSPEAFIVWKDCGLLDENGAERPALEVWRRYFSMQVDEK